MNDSTIDLIYHAYGESHCACSCGFELTYIIAKNCLLNEGFTDRIKAITVNGNQASTRLLQRSR